MTTTAQMTRRTAAMLLIASLAACGGGGGGSGEGGNSGGGEPGGSNGGGTGGGSGGGEVGGGSDPGSSAVTGTYSLKSAANNHTQLLADANSMGQQGYVLLSTLGTNTMPTSMGDFYVSDTTHTGHKFSYVQQAAVGTKAEFVAQLNQQGANGYVFKSGAVFADPSDIRSVFVKDDSRSDAFSYEVTSPASTAAAFSEELNKRGARGYRYMGPQFLNNEIFGLYIKRNDNVSYQYEVENLSGASLAADSAGLQKLLADKGAQGWLARGAEGVGDPMAMNFVAIYEKSSAQSGAVEYLVEAASGNASLEDMKNQMNVNAGKGFFFWSEMGTADNKFSTISIKNNVWLIHPLAGVSFPSA